MDIIQEAKEVLKNWKEGLIRPTEHNNDASMDLISRLVDRLEWKSVENELPDNNQKIIVFVPFESGQSVQCILMWKDAQDRPKEEGIFLEGLGEAWPHGSDFGQITHWMPLPLPPVGDKQK